MPVLSVLEGLGQGWSAKENEYESFHLNTDDLKNAMSVVSLVSVDA
jgi:hypothetical protein